MSKKRSFSDKARDILSGTDNANKPKSMREFLEDTPEQDDRLSYAETHDQPSANALPGKEQADPVEPTDRLHCFIPRSLKLRVEAYVLERKRERKKGEKIDITSVVIEALTEKLDRDGG